MCPAHSRGSALTALEPRKAQMGNTVFFPPRAHVWRGLTREPMAGKDGQSSRISESVTSLVYTMSSRIARVT